MKTPRNYVERAVDGAEDLRGTEDAVVWEGLLERLPDKKEVEGEMEKCGIRRPVRMGSG